MSVTGYGRPITPLNRSTDSLADILERVLDKGIVIAGDIMVNVVDIELLTLKVRLLVASVETARDLGIDWWSTDPFLTDRGERLARENDELRGRLERLERAVGDLSETPDALERSTDQPAGPPAAQHAGEPARESR